MVAAAFILLQSFLKIIGEEKEEKEDKDEPRTLRQSLIAGIALVITAFIGLMFLGVMGYFMALVS